MRAGRGHSSSPRAKEEERWLQMAESALFWLRAVAFRLPEEHDLYQDEGWAVIARETRPSDRQVIRIAAELVSLADLPAEHRGQRVLAHQRHRNGLGYRLDQGDLVDLLEILTESLYERREAEL